MDQKFTECVTKLDDLRAPILARKELNDRASADALECLAHFDETTSALWALREQAIHGDNNAPRGPFSLAQEDDFLDESEKSWMWAWIKGAQKWHAWDRCRGMSATDAKFLFIDGVQTLERELPTLLKRWARAD